MRAVYFIFRAAGNRTRAARTPCAHTAIMLQPGGHIQSIKLYAKSAGILCTIKNAGHRAVEPFEDWDIFFLAE